MTLWPGTCIVHETFSRRKLIALRARHPNAEIIAHPECEPAILEMADFVGSTNKLLRYAIDSDREEFIVATESGIITQMNKLAPHKRYYPAPPQSSCACNECPFMRLNTLEKLYACLRDMKPRLEMAEDLRIAARVPIDRMLALS
jgi:quinolinate synthase